MEAYAFPVELQNVFTKTGKVVPRRKAVVRTDDDKVIGSVSDRYKIFKHEDVMNQADSYISNMGKPEKKCYLTQDGASLTAEYTFRDTSLKIGDNAGMGDVVGLRVYVQNSYNGKGALRFRIGAMVVKCLNGMVLPEDKFSLTYRHTKEIEEIAFPSINEVYDAFEQEGSKWETLKAIVLTNEKYDMMAKLAVEQKIVPEKALQAEFTEPTAWGLYNQFTYHITHNETSNSSVPGRINRLQKVAKWVDDTLLIKKVG